MNKSKQSENLHGSSKTTFDEKADPVKNFMRTTRFLNYIIFNK
jgi:hypothetical protein